MVPAPDGPPSRVHHGPLVRNEREPPHRRARQDLPLWWTLNLPAGHIRWMGIDHAPPGTYGAQNRPLSPPLHRNLEAGLRRQQKLMLSPSGR